MLQKTYQRFVERNQLALEFTDVAHVEMTGFTCRKVRQKRPRTR